MPHFNEIIELCVNLHVKYEINKKTASLVSFRIGAEASLVVFPKTNWQLIQLLKKIKELKCKYFIIGGGTNTFFSDKQYDGVVIVTRGINNICINNNKMLIECGASINNCCNLALDYSLCGLEFAYGIPGTIGGAVYMNASAYGNSVSDIVVTSDVYDITNDEILTFTCEMHEFENKKSIFQTKDYVLLSTKISLKPCDKLKIKARMDDLLRKRLETQPIQMPSAGSTFKRPRDGYASKLIDEAGLKGYRIGDAQVSPKHAGFIVNLGKAKAKDVLELIQYIKNKISEIFKINLEEEIIFVE